MFRPPTDLRQAAQPPRRASIAIPGSRPCAPRPGTIAPSDCSYLSQLLFHLRPEDVPSCPELPFVVGTKPRSTGEAVRRINLLSFQDLAAPVRPLRAPSKPAIMRTLDSAALSIDRGRTVRGRASPKPSGRFAVGVSSNRCPLDALMVVRLHVRPGDLPPIRSSPPPKSSSAWRPSCFIDIIERDLIPRTRRVRRGSSKTTQSTPRKKQNIDARPSSVGRWPSMEPDHHRIAESLRNSHSSEDAAPSFRGHRADRHFGRSQTRRHNRPAGFRSDR